MTTARYAVICILLGAKPALAQELRAPLRLDLIDLCARVQPDLAQPPPRAVAPATLRVPWWLWGSLALLGAGTAAALAVALYPRGAVSQEAAYAPSFRPIP